MSAAVIWLFQVGLLIVCTYCADGTPLPSAKFPVVEVLQ